MAVEYANKKEDTQEIFKPMTLTLLMMIARHYRDSNPKAEVNDVTEGMVHYMEDHLDHITLSMLASRFGYHPSYISAKLSEQRGETFSQILLGLRMKRAVFLMRNTDLSIEEITPMIGYNDKSNFHKAFRAYYGKTPRQFLETQEG